MFDTDNETQERGQVGIGTLIVFIALVLVAAIAAGVLINTAGFLQSQAEATGEESVDQVANNLEVTQVVGLEASVDNQELAPGTAGDPVLEATVQLAPGSDAINLDEVDAAIFAADEDRIELAAPFAGETLESGETETLEIAGDQFEGNQIDAGTSITIVLTTGDGSQTQIGFTVDDPIESDGDILLT